MDMLKQLNAAIEYIESNLCDEIDLDSVAGIACVTKDSFVRFFSYMTGMTLTEYIRRRRLTLAAYELQNSNSKVIDIAVKYGWDSADAFTKAFTHQHGITPKMARDSHESLKIYPPASFCIMIKEQKKWISECSFLCST
jgi:AraC family transcriptional regulator